MGTGSGAGHEALRAGEDLFRAFVRQSRDGIVIVDSQGTILEWNQGQETITGIPAAEALGRPVWEVQHRLASEGRESTEGLRAAEAKVRAGLSEGARLRRVLEDEIRCPDGSRRIIETILFGIATHGAPIAGGICRDVTARRRAEEQQRRMQGLLDDAERLVHLGHIESDPTSGRDSWSDEVYRILGHAPGSLEPTFAVFLAAIVPEDRGRLAEVAGATARDGLAREIEFRVTTAQGRERVLLGRVAHLRPEGGRAAACSIATIQDITERKHAEELLRESETRFRIMADSAPVLIWVADMEGNNQFVNRAYCDFFGKRAEEVEGAGWQPLLHPDDAQEYVAAFHAGLRAGELVHAQVRARRHDGQWRWLESHAALRRSSSGEVLGMTGTSLDVTERKQAEHALVRSREDLRQAQAVAHVGSWRLDLERGELDWSEETHRIFGVALGTAMTFEAFLDRVHPEDRPFVVESWRAALQGQRYDIEHRIVVGGEVKWVREVAHLELGRDGAVRAGFGTVQDITDRKLMRQALADANRRKDEFLALLSHELRNPLAPLHSSLHVIERAEPGGEQARRMHAIITRQVRQLTRLVDDLLDITRISRGKIELQLERCELTGIVRRTLEDHRSAFEAAGILLEDRTAAAPLWLAGDATRIAQVVGNLLHNAVKFTPAGGKVEVGLEAAGGEAVLRVRDTGVGIEPEVLARLFEPFVQAPQTQASGRGGLGLGLALVRSLVELHGGRVSAASEGAGRGAELTVRLPLEAAAAPAATAVAETKRPVVARRVLVIEDNIDAAASLAEALRLDGHEVQVAYDGPAGLARARASRPEVVLCDIGLPGMDGYAIARAMRSDEALQGAYLVALTGYALPEDLRRAWQAGFDRHLAKPPSFAALAEILASAR